MSDRKPLRLGLIGLGNMGRNHLRVLSVLKGAEIGFIYDSNADLTRELAQSYGVPASEDLDRSLADVDAVVICTPTSTHEEYIRLAARHVRQLFVEKPLTSDLSSSRAMAELATAQGLDVQVGFIERFNPAVQQLKAVLDRSEKVLSIDFFRTSKLSSRITDVDVVADLMIHDIDLALYMNGPVESVAAHGVHDNGMIDFASTLLTHRNGRFSRIQASRITDRKMRSIQATCGDMFVNCDLLRKEIVITRQAIGTGNEFPYVISAVEETIAVRPEEALLAELQTFVGGRSDPKPGVAEALEAIAICEEVQRCVRG